MLRISRIAVCLSAFVLPTCGPSGPPIPDPPEVACSTDAETAQVWGPWKLDFRGERDACDQPALDGSFEMRPTLEFEVSQREDTDTPGTDRLRLSRSVEGMQFSGSVQGDCVTFSLSEEKEDGTAMTFAGIVGDGEIDGSLTGNGPGKCRTTGTFHARFRQATVPR